MERKWRVGDIIYHRERHVEGIIVDVINDDYCYCTSPGYNGERATHQFRWDISHFKLVKPAEYTVNKLGNFPRK